MYRSLVYVSFTQFQSNFLGYIFCLFVNFFTLCYSKPFYFSMSMCKVYFKLYSFIFKILITFELMHNFFNTFWKGIVYVDKNQITTNIDHSFFFRRVYKKIFFSSLVWFQQKNVNKKNNLKKVIQCINRSCYHI